MKKCANKYDVNAADLLHLIRQQEAEDREKVATGASIR